MGFDLKKMKTRGYADLTCLDFGNTGLKALRLKKNKEHIAIVACDILPPVDTSAESDSRPASLKLPKHLRANYAAVTVSSHRGVAKLINLPSQSSQQAAESQIREQFGIDGDFRLVSVALNPAKSKSGSKLLAAAVPEVEIRNMLAMTASGPPAPCSYEVAALSALTAFLHSGKVNEEEGVCFLEMGAISTYIFFLYKQRLLLLRRYDVGGQKIINRIVNDFQVDSQTATNIMSEGAIDLSAFYEDAFGFIIRQITISRDFVERQEGCRIGGIHVSGGMASSGIWSEMLHAKTGLEAQSFDPFQGLEILPDALPDHLDAQSSRFTAAAGAGLGVFAQE